MNTQLEDFIKANRSSFDHLDPSPANWEKIKKANRLKIKPYTNRLMVLRSLTAIVIIALGTSLYFSLFSSGEQSPGNQLSAELNETMLYYNTQIAIKKQEVFQLTAQHPGIQEELEKDLEELDAILNELKEDLNDNIDNSEVVEAMIQNYRIKISILEDIQQYMNKKSTPKKNNAYDL
jgi:hypothetical protein